MVPVPLESSFANDFLPDEGGPIMITEEAIQIIQSH